MGTISQAKLAGISLILGPTITVICYFYQQMVIYADVEANSAASWAALTAAGGGAVVATSLIIPLSLMALVYGLLFIANEIRGSGNGGALAGYGAPMVLIGLTGWVLASGMSISVANSLEPAATGTAVSLAASGINNIAGFFFSIGFATVFFAMASRDEYNSNLANAAGLLAVVAAVLTGVGVASLDQSALMTQLVGLTYIIHTLYAIYIGRGILKRS